MPDRPRTKSSAQAFGFVHCPECNPNCLPSHDIPSDLPCAWCWDTTEKVHFRYVKVERLKEWRVAHGLPEDDEDEIETSPQTRQALSAPPPLSDKIPDTERSK